MRLPHCAWRTLPAAHQTHRQVVAVEGGQHLAVGQVSRESLGGHDMVGLQGEENSSSGTSRWCEHGLGNRAGTSGGGSTTAATPHKACCPICCLAYQDALDCLNLVGDEVVQVKVGSSNSCHERLRNRGEWAQRAQSRGDDANHC